LANVKNCTKPLSQVAAFFNKSSKRVQTRSLFQLDLNLAADSSCSYT